MQQGVVSLDFENLDLREVATEAVRWAQCLASPKHQLEASLPTDPVCITADRKRLLTMLQSLLDNALKYSPKGGPILLQIVSDASRARVMVIDRGVGMRHEQLVRLFRPFGRLVTDETADIDGVGLGLYVAGELARVQGGEITVQSEPGCGSTFTLSIPVTLPPAPEAGPSVVTASMKAVSQ